MKERLDKFSTTLGKLFKNEWGKHVNPNRDSPNGYPTVTPTELQPVTLAH